MPSPQLHLRVPEGTQDLFRRIAARLRHEPHLADRLQAVLEGGGVGGGDVGPDADFREKVYQLERDVWHLRAMLGVTDAGEKRIKHQIERGKPTRQIAADLGVPVEVVGYLRGGMDAPEACTEATEAPAAALETGDRTDLLETADSGHTGAGEAYTRKRGQRVYITEAGERRIKEMWEADHSTRQIGDEIGVSGQAIRNRLKEWGLR